MIWEPVPQVSITGWVPACADRFLPGVTRGLVLLWMSQREEVGASTSSLERILVSSQLAGWLEARSSGTSWERMHRLFQGEKVRDGCVFVCPSALNLDAVGAAGICWEMLKSLLKLSLCYYGPLGPCNAALLCLKTRWFPCPSLRSIVWWIMLQNTQLFWSCGGGWTRLPLAKMLLILVDITKLC